MFGGIFTPHFERSEIVAGPPAEPIGRKIRSDFFKYTPPVYKYYIFMINKLESSTSVEDLAVALYDARLPYHNFQHALDAARRGKDARTN